MNKQANTCFLLLLIGTSLLLVNEVHAFGLGHTRDCLCQKYEARVIPPKNLRSIEILPKGPHCKTAEVIAGLVSGEKVCLDVQAQWVRKVIQKILDKKRQKW